MAIYKIVLDNGTEGLIAARSIISARKQAFLTEGTMHVRSVKKASDDDTAWVEAMGGRVPAK